MERDLDILLINPSYQPHWSRCEPTGLLYLASYLKEHGLRVGLFDFNLPGRDFENLSMVIENKKPFMACLSILTLQASKAYDISRFIKKKFSDVSVVFGGVHATFVPDEAFLQGNADFVIKGEAEISLLKLAKMLMDRSVKDKNLEEIGGLLYKIDDRVIENEGKEINQDLDKLPFPDYSLIDIKEYNTNIHVSDGNAFHVMTSRGCPGNCIYCASPALYQRKVRFRSPENIIKELIWIKDNFKVNRIHFHDDNFMLQPERLKKLCRLMIDHSLGIEWVALARVDTIVKHQDLLELMKKAGCRGLEIGVESASSSVLLALGKGTDVSDIYEANKLIKQNGILPLYLMIAYSPKEDIDGPYESAKLLYELKYGKLSDEAKYLPIHSFFEEEVMGHLMRPSPGSAFYDMAKDEGLVLSRIWDDHYEERINFLPYSFLKDIPIRTDYFDDPGKVIYDYSKLIRYLIDAVFYGSNETIAKFVDDYNRFMLFLHEVYLKCDGKRDVQDIFGQIHNDYYRITLQDVASAISYLSIMRLIRSGAKRG